jgi:hypothetical protein
LLSARVRESTGKLQDDAWHIDLSPSRELNFPIDGLVAVGLAFDAIPERVSGFAEQANDHLRGSLKATAATVVRKTVAVRASGRRAKGGAVAVPLRAGG